MNHTTRTHEGQRGSAFFVVLILAFASVVMVSVFLRSSVERMRSIDLKANENAAFNAAESGLNRVIEEVWGLYQRTPHLDRLAVLDELDGKNDEANRIRYVGQRMDPCTYDVFVREVRAVGTDYADLDSGLLLLRDPYVGLTIERGRMILPGGPGLGVERRGGDEAGP